jgi:hypothetical protein
VIDSIELYEFYPHCSLELLNRSLDSSYIFTIVI